MKRLLAVIAFTGLCSVCASGAVATEDDLELARFITIEQIDNMHGLTFEAYVCRLLESRGYDVENIRPSNDFGVDAVATKGKERIAIQIKRSKAPIDRRAISDASAGKDYHKCNKAMVITNSTLTESARKFATEIQCGVVERDQFLAWVDEFKRGTKRQSQTPVEQ